MGINHFDIATEGIRKNHQWIATLGYWLLDITVEKFQPSNRYEAYEWEEWNLPLDHYVITIRVKHKGKTWTLQRGMSDQYYERIKILATFLRFEKARAVIKATYIKMINTIKVLAKRKD